MGVKKVVRTKKPARASRSKIANKSAKFVWGIDASYLPVAASFAALVALLVVAYQFSSPAPAPEAIVSTNTAREAPPAAVAAPQPSTEDEATQPPSDATDQAEPQIVTLTGCLERSDEHFRLTDTSGVNAPKARSWKRAFLTSRPSPVDIVGGASDASLSRHVGHRVTVSGKLTDRELRVGTLRRVANSCEEPPRVKA